MDRSEELKQSFASSRLPEILTVRVVDYYAPPKEFTALRFASNPYRLRAIEIWEGSGKPWFRIYHSEKIAQELKSLLDELQNFDLKASSSYYTDYYGDSQQIAAALGELLVQDDVALIVKTNQVLTRNKAYEGLQLPDVEVGPEEAAKVLGRTFTWKEILAIDEDTSETNALKQQLSKPGVYLQRSPDGRARYVGAAYGADGIFGRWLKHLSSNGHAKHLNLYVLENGYANVLFTVLEFTSENLGSEKVLEAEARWKETLGTRNTGAFDGIRLNNN